MHGIRIKKTLNDLKQKAIDNPSDISIQKSIDEILCELEKISILQTKGAMLRAKSKWNEEGERNTSYFLSLEKKNGQDKSILYLKEDNDDFITERSQVSAKIFNFYKSLYSSTSNVDREKEKYFLNEEFS